MRHYGVKDGETWSFGPTKTKTKRVNTIPIPEQVIQALQQHRVRQEEEKQDAGSLRSIARIGCRSPESFRKFPAHDGRPGTGRLRGWRQIADALGATDKTIRRWIADAADDDARPPIFKVADAPQAPVMAARGELLRRARRYPVTEA